MPSNVEANPANPPQLELVQVTKTYQEGKVQALRGVSLSIWRGEFLSISGKSGCGKSTLLHLMGGLDEPTSGDVRFDQRSLTSWNLDLLRSSQFGFVFQSFYLLPNLTAWENVQIPMLATPSAPKARRQRALDLLNEVGLKDRVNHLPSQLSIGQRQRVAIARAIVNHPSIVFADEPTGSLDSQSGQEVMELLLRLRESLKTTLVLVTHDESLAKLADRPLRMIDGELGVKS